MLKTPVEICVNNNNRIFLLEPGTYYVGRADKEFASEVKKKFGDYKVDEEYKYSIYLFKKSDCGLELIDIISKGLYNFVSRYQFRLDVNPNGDDYSNVILRIGDYGKKPKSDALYPNGSKFKEEKLEFDKYLELLITDENDGVRFKFGLVGVIDIIGPSGYTKKDRVLEYTIRTYTKETIITEESDFIDYLIIDIVDDEGHSEREISFEVDHNEQLFEKTIEVKVGMEWKYFQLKVDGVCNKERKKFGRSYRIYFKDREKDIKKDDKIYFIDLKEFKKQIKKSYKDISFPK